MIDNEKHLYKLMQIIEESLQSVIIVHGQISKVSKIGNSAIITFKDGNIYKQPLVSKAVNRAVMDGR